MKTPPLPAAARLLLVEDQPAFRDHLMKVLHEDPSAVICGHTDSVWDAIRKTASGKPDAVLVHLSRGESAAVSKLIKHLQTRGCKAPVLVLTAHEEFYRADRLLRQGVKGCLTERECTAAEIQAAFAKILGGEVYLSPHLTRSYLRGISSPQTDPRISKIVRLTSRELEIFRLMGMGLTTRQIAEGLHLSEPGVVSHRFRIRRKLGIQNTAELYHHAVHWEGLGQGRISSVSC